MTKKTEQYRVPSLAEASTEYAELLAKRAKLLAQQTEVKRERHELLRQIEEAPAPAYRPGVAALLGEGAETTFAARTRVTELATLDADIAQAIEVIRQRLQAARTAASKEVCIIVRPEYGRRVAAICEALKVVREARAAYDDLRHQFEDEDIAWTSLTPLVPTFLGDARDGHIERYLKEAKEAGYCGN